MHGTVAGTATGRWECHVGSQWQQAALAGTRGCERTELSLARHSTSCQHTKLTATQTAWLPLRKEMPRPQPAHSTLTDVDGAHLLHAHEGAEQTGNRATRSVQLSI